MPDTRGVAAHNLSGWGAPLPFPTLLKCTVRYNENHTATWKVLALVNGEIEAVSGPAAHDRPGAHEWIVWQGPAPDKLEDVSFPTFPALAARGGSGRFGGGQKSVVYGLGERTGLLQVLKVTC